MGWFKTWIWVIKIKRSIEFLVEMIYDEAKHVIITTLTDMILWILNLREWSHWKEKEKFWISPWRRVFGFSYLFEPLRAQMKRPWFSSILIWQSRKQVLIKAKRQNLVKRILTNGSVSVIVYLWKNIIFFKKN